MVLSASLVLYQNNPQMVKNLLESLAATPIDFELSIIDNSPQPALACIFQDFNVDYYFNCGNNVGFSRGHNLALKRVKKHKYHLVLNPDIFFEKNVLSELIAFLDINPDIGLVSPKILYPSGEIQYLCKRYPSVLILFVRRFLPSFIQSIFTKKLHWYEMRDTSYDHIFDVPYLSGCFMLFRRDHLDDIGHFDEDIFMYFEDADITLRMTNKHRAVFYPFVSIFHHWAKGSYKSFKLAKINIQSAIYFFNKHGWRFF
jgi:GT2 family glycosyltransferase